MIVLRGFLNTLGWLFSWITLGVVTLGIGLGGVFWLYGRDLPDHEQLATYEPATLSRVYSGRGAVMDEFARERRIYTPIDEIPDIVKQAFISAEDKNFYQHAGFDPLGIAKAIYDAARGGRLRGASTITQQVMKNFLLSGERSAVRKVQEILLATRLEASLTKDEILGLYLNEIFLGQNSYGVTAAARAYFAKSPELLTIAEAAYLAVLPKAPSKYHPVRDKADAIGRRNFVLREMYENGYISREEYEANKELDLHTVQSGHITSASEEMPPRDYFTDQIRRQLTTKLPGGEEELFTGGLTIRATVDPELQSTAAKALRKGLENYDRNAGTYRGPLEQVDTGLLDDEAAWRKALADLRLPRDIEGWMPAVVLQVSDASARIGVEDQPDDEDGHYLTLADAKWVGRIRYKDRPTRKRAIGDLYQPGDVVLVKRVSEEGAEPKFSLRQVPEIQGGFMAMDVKTGRVIAMQGGFSYQHSVFNRATQATRQPGSSFKPFVYAAALDNGYTPASIVVDAPVEVFSGGEIWRPTNASNKFYGPAPMRTGIEQSRNLMTVRIAQDIGMDRVAAYAESFGVYDRMPDLLSYSLGAGETTLMKMVSAYAMFANGGKRVEPTLVDRVQDRYGRTIYRHDNRRCDGCTDVAYNGNMPLISDTRDQVMDPVTAYQLTSMMQGVVSRGTARGTVGKLGVPIAGKTGTTNNAKDVWFIGFTPQIVAGCYMGFDTPRSLGRRAFGGTLCAPVFVDFMKVALQDHGSFEHPQPPGTILVKIDRFTGQRLSDRASGKNVVSELFRLGEEPPIGGFGNFVDGGWAMATDLPLYSSDGRDANVREVVIEGKRKVIPKKPAFGSLSSGGLY